MKKLAIVLLLTLLSLPIMVNAVVWGSGSYDNINVYVFTNKDCKNCDKKMEYLEGLKKDNSRITISEINTDDNKELVDEVKKALNIKSKKLPLVVVGSNYFTGSDKELKSGIDAYLDKDDNCDVVSTIKSNGDVSKCIKTNDGIYKQKSNISMISIIIVIVIAIVVAAAILVIVKKKKNKNCTL